MTAPFRHLPAGMLRRLGAFVAVLLVLFPFAGLSGTHYDAAAHDSSAAAETVVAADIGNDCPHEAHHQHHDAECSLGLGCAPAVVPVSAPLAGPDGDDMAVWPLTASAIPTGAPDALRDRQPRLDRLMDASREDVLAYMDFRTEHWPQVASTNPLERVNREIKRRSDVIGNFPNDAAIIRLVGALILETDDEWAVARRHMSLETLARVTDTGPVKLPGVAARSASSPSEDRRSYAMRRDTTLSANW